MYVRRFVSAIVNFDICKMYELYFKFCAFYFFVSVMLKNQRFCLLDTLQFVVEKAIRILLS